MPVVDLLPKLGVYIDEHFITQKECKTLCRLMETATKTPLGIYIEEDDIQKLDINMRTTDKCELPKEYRKEIYDRIYDLKPSLESFFSEQFSTKIETPKYLSYGEGDFFAPHRDTQLNRRINVSIYLNSQNINNEAHSSDGYTGGELRIYGLLKSAGLENRGISVPGKAGTLVAYPVELLHEVTPIISGTRFAIVSRFLDIALDNK